MSCRPAVMPQTKSYLVRRLDGVEQEVTLLRKATGADCLDKVCHFNLLGWVFRLKGEGTQYVVLKTCQVFF